MKDFRVAIIATATALILAGCSVLGISAGDFVRTKPEPSSQEVFGLKPSMTYNAVVSQVNSEIRAEQLRRERWDAELEHIRATIIEGKPGEIVASLDEAGVELEEFAISALNEWLVVGAGTGILGTIGGIGLGFVRRLRREHDTAWEESRAQLKADQEEARKQTLADVSGLSRQS